jgi:hypothetical protein
MTSLADVRRGFDLREEYAFEEGLRAYAAGFSWLALATLRYLWTNVPLDPAHVPYAPLNQFWHMRRAADPRLTAGAEPNDDTPYSVAWLATRNERYGSPNAGPRVAVRLGGYVMRGVHLDDGFGGIARTPPSSHAGPGRQHGARGALGGIRPGSDRNDCRPQADRAHREVTAPPRLSQAP